ncbi:hypothetical protein LOD99_7647 [Oopsacas minuta]|uniref:Kinetochore protein Nuf2 N-terminal domain-containing protein n=1 Tax=Oopsacas minuta TaxID=111878 RepID=A0AAV7JNP5_9METZ|nr:hypothetical protein LOD99_7647 [Oopsacas minuta]
MAGKLKKLGKKAKQDRLDIDGIIGILPILSDLFNIDHPIISTEDLLSCDPNKIFEIYNFFLRCSSPISAEDLITPTVLRSTLPVDIVFTKDLARPYHNMRFFFAVREMFCLASAPTLFFKDIAAPDLSRTIMFFKIFIEFLRFSVLEESKTMDDKRDEDSLRAEVCLLKQEVSNSLETYEMNLAKADMEENAKDKVREEMTAICSELDFVIGSIPAATVQMQESEKIVLHSKDRISQAKLYLLDKRHETEKKSKLIVSSPDKLLEQRTSSKRTLDSLCEEQNSLEAQISHCKKLEAYDSILEEFEVVLTFSKELEFLVKDTELANQTCASLIRQQEVHQTELESVFQSRALITKRIDNLKEKHERLINTTNQHFYGEAMSKLPNEAEVLQSELERNIENIDDAKLDIASLNEVMEDYRKSFREQKGKLTTYLENFTEHCNNEREKLETNVTRLISNFKIN